VTSEMLKSYNMKSFLLVILLITVSFTLFAQLRPNPSTASASELINYSYASYSLYDKVSFRSEVVKRFKGTSEYYFAQAYLHGQVNDTEAQLKVLEEGMKKFPHYMPLAVSYISNKNFPLKKRMAIGNSILKAQPEFSNYIIVRTISDNIDQKSYDSLKKIWNQKLKNPYVFNFLDAVRETDKIKALDLYYLALDKPGAKDFFYLWQKICDLELNVLYNKLNSPFKGLRMLIEHCSTLEESNDKRHSAFLSEAYNYLAKYAERKNLRNDALQYYQESYRHTPTFESAEGIINTLNANHLTAPECTEFIKTAIRDLSDVWVVYFTAAWVNVRENHYSEADRFFNFAIDKTNTITDKVRATLDYATFLRNKTFQYDEATRLLKDLLTWPNANKAEIYYALYETRYLAGFFKEAQQYLENSRTIRRLEKNINENFYANALEFLSYCNWLDSIKITSGASLLKKPIGISASASILLDWAAFSNDRKTLISGFQPTQWWDLEKQSLISNFEGLLDGERKFSPNDEFIAQLCHTQTSEDKYLLTIIELKTGTVKAIIPLATSVFSFSWSPDNKQIIVSSGTTLSLVDIHQNKFTKSAYIPSGERLSNIHVKWLTSGKIFYGKKYFGATAGILSPTTLEIEKELGWFDMVHAMDETKNGKFICLTDNNRKFYYWDTETYTKREFKTQELPKSIISHPIESKVLINDWGGGDKNNIALYDLETGKKLEELSLPVESAVRAEFSASGENINVLYNTWDHIASLKAKDFKGQTKFESPSSRLKSVYYFKENSLLITHDDEGLHAWGLRDGKKIGTLKIKLKKIFQPVSSNQLIVVTEQYDTLAQKSISAITYVDPQSLKLTAIDTIRFRVEEIGLHNDKLIIAGAYFTKANVGAQYATIRVTDFKTGKLEAEWDFEIPTDILLAQYLGGSGITSMDISPDGALVALKTWWQDGWRVSATQSKVIRVFELATGKELNRSHTLDYTINQIAFLSQNEIRINNWVYEYPSWKYLREDNTNIKNPIAEHLMNTNDQVFIDTELNVKIKSTITNEIKFFDSKDDAYLGTLVCRKNNIWIFFTENNFYESTPTQVEKIYLFQTGELVLPYDQMFSTYFRPGLMRDVLTKRFATTRDEKKERQIVDLARKVPIVRFVSPTTGFNAKKSSAKVLIEVTDNGSGITEIQLYQNGKLVSIQAVPNNPSQKTFTELFDVTLTSGVNVLKASAISKDKIEAIPDLITVTLNQEEQIPTLFLLTIGIDVYKNSNYNLNYGVADAKAIEGALKSVESQLFRGVKTYSVHNALATKENIVKIIAEIKSIAKPHDVFVLFYAGHGVIIDGDDATQSDFFLVLHDVTQMYGASVSQKGLNAGELKTLLAELLPQKQIILLDACQSGGAVDAFASRGAEREKAIIQLGRSTGIFVLASAGSTQFATEFVKLGHGVFTYAILETLNGKSDSIITDGKLTIKELEAYLSERVPELTQMHKGTQQWPTSFSRGQDFPLRIFEKK
jgi:WD40 repeat protein